jgi:hypothetical protein
MAVSGTSIAFGVFIPPSVKAMSWSHSALSFTYALPAVLRVVVNHDGAVHGTVLTWNLTKSY